MKESSNMLLVEFVKSSNTSNYIKNILFNSDNELKIKY